MILMMEWIDMFIVFGTHSNEPFRLNQLDVWSCNKRFLLAWNVYIQMNIMLPIRNSKIPQYLVRITHLYISLHWRMKNVSIDHLHWMTINSLTFPHRHDGTIFLIQLFSTAESHLIRIVSSPAIYHQIQ